MALTEAEELFKKGVRAVDSGNWLTALACFEKVVMLEERPVYLSYLAACIARERGQFNKAELLCRESLDKEPDLPVHYLNLGRVLLFQGKKKEAIQTFREGMGKGYEQRIVTELERLGTRKKPVIPWLRRDNPLNKFLGILLTRLGLRK